MMKFVKYDIKKIEILLMLLFVAFQSRAYDFEKDGIYYNFNGTIPFEVFVTYRDNPFDVGYQPSYSGVVVIPETVEFANKYYRITEIGDFAFRGCTSNFVPGFMVVPRSRIKRCPLTLISPPSKTTSPLGLSSVT